MSALFGVRSYNKKQLCQLGVYEHHIQQRARSTWPFYIQVTALSSLSRRKDDDQVTFLRKVLGHEYDR